MTMTPKVEPRIKTHFDVNIEPKNVLYNLGTLRYRGST